jgi:hypothetical protein
MVVEDYFTDIDAYASFITALVLKERGPNGMWKDPRRDLEKQVKIALLVLRYLRKPKGRSTVGGKLLASVVKDVSGGNKNAGEAPKDNGEQAKETENIQASSNQKPL